MSEEENDPVVQNGLEINSFIDAVGAQNFVQAERIFSSLMDRKIGDALDQTKIKIASSLYNDGDDDDIDDDVSDEEIDDAIDDETEEDDDYDDEE